MVDIVLKDILSDYRYLLVNSSLVHSFLMYMDFEYNNSLRGSQLMVLKDLLIIISFLLCMSGMLLKMCLMCLDYKYQLDIECKLMNQQDNMIMRGMAHP